MSPSRSWRASGAPRSARARSAARPEGSLHVAVDRARELWDGLTGGPPPLVVDYKFCDCGAGAMRPSGAHAPACAGIRSTGHYSEAAAAAILDAGLRLWPDTAASMAGPEDDGEG